METTKQISPHMEDYLEAIYEAIEQKGVARSKDIATALGVKAASVTGALRVLSKKGLVNYAPYDLITFTYEGRKLAEEIANKHKIIKDFLTDILLVDQTEAESLACELEHIFKGTLLARLQKLMEKEKSCRSCKKEVL